jgi:Asp-tRNA(Asn)/Glu-tRNA(Gln) amidotransferase A subunit family amidase
MIHFRSGESPLGLSCYLERIDRLEPSIHAFITARRIALQAQTADRRIAAWRKGSAARRLFIPLVVATYYVKDIRCTCGSRILETSPVQRHIC